MMRKFLTPILFLVLSCFQNEVKAQVPSCSPSVPFFLVDLTGHPNGTWESPVHSRSGNCCSSTNPDRCTSFEILLDTGAAMINFEIASGAIPSGSMYYQIGCGTPVAVGQPICIVGPGPHYLTFCKPGNNTNTYRVTSIPKPLFPKDDTARIGCSLPLHVLGLTESSISWTSVFPGPVGAYNNYLSCANNCDTVLYTPAANAPAYVDYRICGTPIATLCGYVPVCDTVRIYNFAALTANVTPNPATFCVGGPGVLLTGSAIGGQAPYSYTWLNQSAAVVGSNSTYNTILGGTYQLRIRDVLYDSLYCPAAFVSVPVTAVQPPTANAGPDQTLCPSSPTATLQASVTDATGGIWTGGAGTYNPNNTSLVTEYTPTAGEIAAGQVTLTFTTTGAGGGCTNASDAVTIHFPPALSVSLPPQALLCNNSTTTLSPVVTGGISPYTFDWNNGATTSSVTVGQGNYCVAIVDAMGCNTSSCTNVTAPSALIATLSSVDVTTNGGNNGSATATPSGGTGPYSYLWSPGGQTTQTATGLSYGVYSVVITDANGCSFNSSIVVNEPQCLGFQVTTSGTNILCHGDATGTALAIASGGTAPYSYVWNTTPPQTTASATNLSAGSYLVTVTETNGCIHVGSVIITQPTQMTNTITNTDVTTVGGNDGSATANPLAGTPPYTYAWSTGGTTQTVNGLSAGTYTVTISDNNGCSLIDSAIVLDPECSSIIMNTYSTSVSCFGGSDGSASAEILFGIPPYSYNWSNGGTTPTITGLTAGVYTVLGESALLCPHVANVTVTQPSLLSLTLVPTSVRCNASHDGTIELTVTGGTYPYTYAWSNGLAVEDLVNLGPGTYSVLVTDAHGCTATATTTITEPSAISVSSVHTDVTCNGGNNGSIDVTVSGGVFPYVYSWNSGQTTQDLSNLSIGTYALTVVDANGCVDRSLGVPINEPSVVTIDSINTACPIPGSGVAQVTVYPNGGSNTSYQVSFDNGVTFLAPGIYSTSLPAGNTYQVVVHDNNGCSTTSATTLVIHPVVDIQSVSFNPCIADGVTSIPVTLVTTGGNGGLLQSSFDNGATYLAPGVMSTLLATGASYNIVVKDSSGCLSVTEPISIPNEIVLSGTASAYNGYQVSCFGNSDGAIDLSVNGGAGTYTYAWSTSATTQDASGLAAGTYSVVVTDSLGCRDTIAFTMNQPSALSNTLVSTNNFNGYQVSCNGSTNGAIDLSVSGGVASYTYVWNTSATTEDLSSLGAGTYSVLVTDANGCTTSNTIILTQPAALTHSITATDVLCNGNTTGAIDLSVGGGVTGYTFSWSNSATSEDLSSIGAGSYSVTITDANGCTTTASATITEPTLLTSSGTVTNLTCFQSANGAIDVTVNGGANSYAYAWSNGATTQDLTGLSAGSYSLTITDANGCTNTQSFVVTEPSALAANAIATTNFNGYQVSCNGSTDGAIDLSVNGGTTGYTYNWSNGATTQDLSSIGAGTYTVTITDANNCTTTSSVVLSEPAALTSSTSVTNVLCNGNATGAIDLIVGGGVTAYTFSWSNSATSEDLSSIGAGSYSVTITDANGCTATASATVIEPTLLTSSGTVTNLTCFQSANGAIDVSVSGGANSYTYAWSNAATTQDLNGVAAGSYSLIITDANGCTNTLSFTITEPALLSSSAVATTNFNGYQVSCNGSTDGAIDLSVNGGTMGYTYNWSNSATTQDLSSIGAGTYTVTITDANNCTTTSSVVLSEPAALTSSTSVTNVLCNGNATGAIDLTVGGGVTAYTFNWSNSATSEDLSSIGAGSYSVTITDANGCTTTASATVTEPTLLTSSGTVTNLTCFQSANGAIDVTVNGGANSYAYAWSNGATTQDLTGLSAGSYSLTITDANGCTNTQSFVVTEPSALTANAIATTNFNGYQVSCNGSSDGAIDLSVNGGTTGYTYNWSNGATTEDISAVGAGTYTVTINDANGCTATSSISLSEPAALTSSTSVTNVFCNGNATGAINLTVGGGVMAYSFSWSNSTATEDLSNLGAGTYSVVITDANGCTTTASATITEPSLLSASGMTTNLTCNQSANGAIDLSVNGGVNSYSFAWSNGATTEDLAGIAAGLYSVIITDGNGCTNTQSFTITEPSALTATAIATTNFNGYQVSCNGSTNGAVDLTVSGGTSAYTYSWSNGATTEDLSAIGAGVYIVTVTDANSCLQTATVTLVQPPLLDINASHQDVPCNGFFTGSIDITMNGGVQPYFYYWNNMQTTEDLNNIGAGFYSVNVTDANGCLIDTTVEITESMPVVVTHSLLSPLCFGDNNGGVDLTVSGGTAPYTFNWSNAQTTQNATNLSAGIYTVIISDANGCVAHDTALIADPSPLVSSVTSPLQLNGHNISLPGGNDGSIDLTVTGGTLPYGFEWSNGDTTQNVNGLVAGNYNVIITDANGCTTSSSIALDQPFVLEMPTGYSPNGDGANDYFVVHGIEAYPNNNIEIFNRWGNLVYSADHYHNNWNGYNDSGDQLPDGTYFVILKINGGDITLNGYVDLRR